MTVAAASARRARCVPCFAMSYAAKFTHALLCCSHSRILTEHRMLREL